MEQAELKEILQQHQLWRDGKDGKQADLRGADLRWAQGLIRIPAADPRGYEGYASEQNDGWHIIGGCRDYTLTKAYEHWGSEYKGDPEIGKQWVAAIEWLENKLTHQGERHER